MPCLSKSKYRRVYSELAKDLKILIREKLIDGDSNEEIYGYLRERYGDYILLKPPLI